MPLGARLIGEDGPRHVAHETRRADSRDVHALLRTHEADRTAQAVALREVRLMRSARTSVKLWFASPAQNAPLGHASTVCVSWFGQ